MSYQSLALRRENAAALASRNPARPATFILAWWVTPRFEQLSDGLQCRETRILYP